MLQLSWEDPTSGESYQPLLSVPITFGREASKMPASIDGQQVSPVVLASDQVSRFHASITLQAGQLTITDSSSNGTFVNGQKLRQSHRPLANGDTLRIGPYEITVTIPSTSNTALRQAAQINTSLPATTAPFAAPSPTIAFNQPNLPPAQPGISFPPAAFKQETVSIAAIKATGLPIEENDFIALGAGIGSFTWVDTLRCFGVKAERITVLGVEKKPYGRYQRLCRNSQIPFYERLRSGSDSCPDNIWGWPGYAWRESFREVLSGQISSAIKHLWQVFAEPALADTYTPRSGDVFASLDREATRIGWDRMLRYGRFRSIRKTDDGRYAIAYSRTLEDVQDYRIYLARYVHIAPGYPAIKFLPDLQAYRKTYQDFKSVVNAYEAHEHVYEQLIRQGGTVIVRGRGIVASRIIQRLYESHQKNPKISIVHLMRSPKPEGNKFGLAQRHVENQWEFQPYNWPKGTWGGDMKAKLEAANPKERYQLLTDWGGTTTANRRDWRQIVNQGQREGWYTITFGQVERVEQDSVGRMVTYLEHSSFKGEIKIDADFIIDSTGLEAKPAESPFLNDLVTHYKLPLNPLGRLDVSNDFELVEMRNERGRMYASGVMTLGGPYAPVDTFLGLQYAAQRSVDHLERSKAPVRYLNGFGSVSQWIKWANNQAP